MIGWLLGSPSSWSLLTGFGTPGVQGAVTLLVPVWGTPDGSACSR